MFVHGIHARSRLLAGKSACKARFAAMLMLAFACGAPCHGDESGGGVRELLALNAEEAGQGRLFTLRGVVTFHDPGSGLTFIQDGTCGIRIQNVPENPPIRRGQLVEVRGRGSAGELVNELRCDGDGALRVLGEGTPPPAVLFQLDGLGEDPADGRLVMFDAVLFRVESNAGPIPGAWLHFDFATPSGRYTAYMPGDDAAFWQPYLHGKVRVTAVARSISDRSHLPLGHVFFLPGREDVRLLRPAPADPFDRPLLRLSDLLRPGLHDPFSPVRVSGVVLNPKGSSGIHLRCGDRAISVRYYGGERFVPGERVEVVAYPEVRRRRVSLIEARFRHLGMTDPPQALALDPAGILARYANDELVRFRATVMSNELHLPAGRMMLSAGSHLIELRANATQADLPDPRALARMKRDAVVDVTGLIELPDLGFSGSEKSIGANQMLIRVRTPGDLVLVRPAPWWTTGRLLLVVAALLLVLALSLLWTLGLRRRVLKQTAIIREKIAHETLWQERSRIARDIHDDVGSTLTQIHLLSERGQRLADKPDEVRHQFERILTQGRDAVRALDGIVWAVNPKNDPLPQTVLYLCQTAQDLANEAGVRCRIDIPPQLPDILLGAKIRHHLLLAAKEAIHNAIKHSGASEIRIRLVTCDHTLRIEISDNGRGFDPAAASGPRTGLDSMRRRMHEANGGLELTSSPATGTTTAFTIPLHGQTH